MSITRISKYLSLILRHQPDAIGIQLDEHGWADVAELIRGVSKDYPFNMEVLEEIVRTDDKLRYSFNDNKTWIRANQGHSIPVDVELEQTAPPLFLWHGTGAKFVESIDSMGLIPKSRLYVHLSGDIDTAVKVGKRHGSPVVYKGVQRPDGRGRISVLSLKKRRVVDKRGAFEVFGKVRVIMPTCKPKKGVGI